MCGIIVAQSKKNRRAGAYAFELYKKQKARGSEGFGYLAIKNGRLIGVRRARTEGAIQSLLNKEDADKIFFHHRFPTSTKNTLGTTHPMFVSHPELQYDYYFAHNGIISNARFLKAQHEKLGYEYKTEMLETTVAEYADGRREVLSRETSVFNDSESLAIELARYIEGLQDKVHTVGAAAFWGVSLNKGTDQVVDGFYGKNRGRDLGEQTNNKWWSIGSEVGSDLDEMKLFSFSLTEPNPTVYEQPLNIDEAPRPVPIKTTVVEHKPATQRIIGFGATDRETPSSIGAYLGLENAYYTNTEVMASGAGFQEFHKTQIGGAVYWVPHKYLGEQYRDRPLKKDLDTLAAIEKEQEEQEEHTDVKVKTEVDKQREILWEMACKYAKFDGMLTFYKQKNANHEISYETFTRAQDNLQLNLDELEDKMSTLGIDDNEVATYVDMAIELEKDNIKNYK